MSETILTKVIPPPLLGDVVFTRWKAFDSRLTEWVTHGNAAHEEQICHDEGEVSVIAASNGMNRMNVWEWESRKSYFARENTDWCRFTPAVPLTPAQRTTLEHYFQEAQNTFHYSKGELLLQAMDSFRNWLFNIPYDSEKAVRFRKWGNIRKTAVICSKIVNLGLVRLEFLPVWSLYWSPSDTLNKLQSSTSWTLAEATPGFFGKAEA